MGAGLVSALSGRAGLVPPAGVSGAGALLVYDAVSHLPLEPRFGGLLLCR